MVAVRMKALAVALARLDDDDRALLELSMRRGMSDEEIATVLSGEPEEAGRRRSELLEQLASELKLDGREQRDELFATMQDIPQDLWHGG